MPPVDEEHAFQVLASIPPSVVVRSEDWLKIIHNLILRAAPSELDQLIPDGYKIAKVQEPQRQVSLTKRKAISKYFCDQGKQPSKQLIDLATDLAETKGVFLDEEYIKVWASSGLVYQSTACKTGASQRICGIMQNIDLLEKSIKLTTCAFRLSLLLLFHLVEQNIPLVDKSKLGPGRSRKTIVFEELARQNQVDLNKLRERFRRAKNYLLIAKKGGIGSLLVVGSYPTSLEHLSKKDVELLCRYRESHLPHLQARCEKLNHVAAQLILEGFCMHGWDYLELSKGGHIMDLVGQYVRLDLLASGQIALRLESQYSGGAPGNRNANVDVVQKLSEFQHRTTRTDSGSPRRKRRRLLSGNGYSHAWEEPMTLTTTPGDILEIGIGYLANNISTLDTDGLDSGEGSGKGVEARSQHVSLLPDWPPRWASMNVPDVGLNYGSEAREQTNICPSPKSGGPVSDTDSNIEDNMDEEVRESQRGGHAIGTILEVNTDSSPYHLPAQSLLHQNSEVPSNFVNDILMMDPETAASIQMFSISL